MPSNRRLPRNQRSIENLPLPWNFSRSIIAVDALEEFIGKYFTINATDKSHTRSGGSFEHVDRIQDVGLVRLDDAAVYDHLIENKMRLR